MKVYNEKEEKVMKDYLNEWEQLILNSDEPLLDFQILMDSGRERFGVKFEFFIEDQLYN